MLTSDQYDSLRIITRRFPVNLRFKKLENLPVETAYANPSVKLVVSHCNLASVQKALFFGKPLLCVPILSDEHDVTARVVDFDLGSSLGKYDFEVVALEKKIREIIEEETELSMKIKKNVERIRHILKNSDGTFKIC